MSENSDSVFDSDDLDKTLGHEGEIISDHRGGFGEFGSTNEKGFIDRSFRERIVVVGVQTGDQTDQEMSNSLEELKLLVDTAGADVCAVVTQKLNSVDPSTYVGRGKVDEIHEVCLEYDADTVVFDSQLSPGQQFNLEKILKRSALDRTAVILDIFAQHAESSEGKTQVELAQLEYNLPRLKGKKSFSQQGGGIGTRGPGETQLEVDRRRIERRIHKLQKDLKVIQKRKDNQRKARNSSRLKKISIVGYTNAGKSSLLNTLTGAHVLVEDKLFATLDPTTRKTQLVGGQDILLTDTVGFVSNLPHQLVEAFKSTLEVARQADLLLHVVDSSNENYDSNITAVNQVLEEIKANDIPTLLVFNKCDLLSDYTGLVAAYPDAVIVSAYSGAGIENLKNKISEMLMSSYKSYSLFIPWSRGDIIAEIHREGRILSSSDQTEGVEMVAELEPATANAVRTYIL